MSLLDDLRNPDNFLARKGPLCTVCILLTELPTEESEALTSLLVSPKVPAAAIARILQPHGHKIAAGTISRHRLGQCRGLEG